MSTGSLDQLDDIQALIQWATHKGVRLDGIKPLRLPGRGIGVVATRGLEEGETILTVPASAIRSLHTVPPGVSAKLPLDMSIHGLLAADLALDDSSAPYHAVFPRRSDFEASVPFMWPAGLHHLLAHPAKVILREQQARFRKDWEMFSRAFPDTREEEYAYTWFLVNTRTFYYETPETSLYPWEDRLALLPVADLFNHSESGCQVSFSPDGYSITADRTYEASDEVCISYGEHSNDYLLAEYGFLLSENKWDRVCFDDVILPRLSELQKEEMERGALLGECVMDPHSGLCDRAKTVLHVLRYETGDSDHAQSNVEERLQTLIRELSNMASGNIDKIQRLKDGHPSQRALLAARWRQIRTGLEKAS